ncbi:DUF3892 domain-containing protein [Staphylococcus delphini]|uniref:DUF3892 domain-containing protein n=1 Tax=Staphylococcus delphini TaxID=53344 RepID=UPI0023B2DAB2|nr:DUF3892 domain-containing protein [Staphylococcus delphini]MDE9798928.1 DUF3892 domain-containing protein [Staphylococcus delphini]MDE9806099.1 DUF3892 domain-containing protein [Staphylococcus delphini]
MSYEIKKIRLTSNANTGTEKISEVLLHNGVSETVAQVVRYLDSGMEYFYTTSYSSTAIVESVHPAGRSPYIRTVGNGTESDNLLSLPRF